MWPWLLSSSLYHYNKQHLLFHHPQHLVISAFCRCKSELNLNDQWDALIMACLHICFTDHAPLFLYCLFVWKMSMVDMLDYTGTLTHKIQTNTRTHIQKYSIHFLSEVTCATSKLSYPWFVLVKLSWLPFSSHFSCSYPRIRGGTNRGIPSWIQTFCSWVFHYILLKNSLVPDALLLLSVFTSWINSVDFSCVATFRSGCLRRPFLMWYAGKRDK